MSRFNTRGFVSLLLSLSFVIAVATGLVLWLTHSPQTFGVGRGNWKHIHIFVALLMTVAGAWHLVLNWPVYRSYLWQKCPGRINLKWEVTLAVAITGAVACTTLLEQHGGPSTQLAAMSLQQIAGHAGQPVQKLVAALKGDGIEVHNPADSLREIAEHNKLSAERVCAAVERQVPGGIRPSRGR
ncbi:MAG: DUF4405 domain-containing protein [Planctomycetaceae bacterium]|nr:DUF4405 domain-containing protein [Planctomycetaceae bacterium]